MEDIKPEIKRHIDTILELHMQEEDRRFEELLVDIKELKVQMQAFTEAWQQAKGVVTFIKWIVSIASGVTAFFLFIKDHIK
jgi:hypothetical protein